MSRAPRVDITLQDLRRLRIRIILICASLVLVAAFAVAWYSHRRSVLESQALVYDALKLAKAGEYKDTTDRLDLAINLNPADLRAYQLRATTHHDLGDDQHAILDATQVIDHSPAPVFEAYQVRALAYVDLRDYRRAVEDLNHALELSPRWAAGYTLRGNAYWQTGDSRRAIQDFTQSIEREPNFEAYYQRGLIREVLGDYKGAMDDYTNAANMQPNMLYPYHARARLRRRFGDLAGAEADEKKVQAIQKSSGPEDAARGTSAPSPSKPR